ncbi:lysosome-associated membrane glycoprotein 2 isoform X2 [Brachyhypopomus gauderio]|uniref:lysosome-associated membrane glycoprotein 2 isoform X2 n=1 Tax=Brachyhypopomus gauderio TaxID=698409 RepID=UPI00404394A4
MFRCVCAPLVLVVLSGVMCTDVLLSDYQWIVPTSATEETGTPLILFPHSFTDGVTDTTPTSEPTTPTVTETTPESQTTATTTTTTTAQTNATTTAATTAQTNATTTAATTAQTNATTTAATTPHTNATTTAATTPHTNATTTAATTPHTNATTTAATSTPSPTTTAPPLPNPTVGDYSVRADPNASICLMAKMGLQFSFISSVGAKMQTINVDPSPNVTAANGTCGSFGSDAVLTLTSDKIAVQFTFTNQTNKFHLRVLNFTVDIGNGTKFVEINSNLSLWEASLGSSYMCRKEQSYNITDKLTLNTFELQVQPFGVIDDKFSTAEECFLDADLSFLVPIAVGVALGLLIVLVLISYLIGRRKSRTGYQSV